MALWDYRVKPSMTFDSGILFEKGVYFGYCFRGVTVVTPLGFCGLATPQGRSQALFQFQPPPFPGGWFGTIIVGRWFDTKATSGRNMHSSH